MSARRRVRGISPLVRRLAALLLLLAWHAQLARAAEPSTALKVRADQIVTLVNGSGDPAQIFVPSFLAQVPPAQLAALSKQLTGQYGAARSVIRFDATSPSNATAYLDFERAIVPTMLAIEPDPPGRITGLLFTPGQVKGDTLSAVVRDLQSLPGEVSIAVATMEGDEPPVLTVRLNADKPLAVGSAFKLFLLAELSREISARQRRWTDVVQLSHRSIPSGILQTWPEDAPVTLHTLAALMISQSDNTAADTMLHLLGREKVEQLLPKLGIAAPDRLRPLLTTREAALLKTDGDPGLLRQWAASSEAGRRAMLDGPLAAFSAKKIDLAKLAGDPVAIDSVEWFVSTGDLIRVMNWLRLHGDKRALDIMAINNGLTAVAAAEFSYVGYKGGSESGVMNMTFLLRGKQGAWHAVAGTWNDRSHPVDEAKFVALMGRAVALVK